MKNLFTLSLLFSFILLMSCQQKIKTWDITSPDGNITFELVYEIKSDSVSSIRYNVSLQGREGTKSILQDSPLGIIRENDAFTDQLTFVEELAPVEIEDSYQLVSGKKRNLTSHGYEKTVIFENPQKKKLAVDFRVYDDGVAFRYRFPDEDSTQYRVTGELTSFRITGSGKKWIHPYDTVTKYTPAYETYFKNGIPIGTNANGKEGWAFPALFETEDIWFLLTESNLNDHFYGSHLQPDIIDHNYRIRLPEPEEARDTGPREPVSSLPWTMPWRVVIIGNELSTIVESNLVYHLADESVVEDISWIKPGRASWSWWSDHDSPQNYDELIPFVDLAQTMGWEYSLVDANWNVMKNGDLKKVADYANEKGVGILVWYNSGGPHNTVGEQLRDAMHLRERRREEFQKLQEMGVKGIKVDFFQSDKPHIIKQYHDILRDAEDFHILCNFHGCTLPRGWRRTYPHLVTMEAVRGAECYSFDSRYPEIAPWHNTILPFTRNAVGPMDYTPVTFSDQTYPHITSYAHELALAVVFESGIIHYADRVEAYLGSPDFVQTFLKELPSVWDDIKFIDGYPGKYSVIARKYGNKWYIGAINGQDVEQQVTLNLTFLDEGEYMLEFINDGDDDRSFRYSKKPFKTGDNLNVDMRARGGFVTTINRID